MARARQTTPTDTDTATAILDIAEELVQRRGFSGFSYADISADLGITKASLHYHYPTKAELGASLITRYSARFADALTDIDIRQEPATSKLEAYCAIYRAVLAEQRMCLCGMLAAEYELLPDPIRRAVIEFFDHNHAWLSNLLEQGTAAGTLRFAGTPDEAAHSIIATLEGAMLVSRPYGNTTLLDSVADRLIAEFSTQTMSRPERAKPRPRRETTSLVNQNALA